MCSAQPRSEHDRIRNIVLLGVMTFGWTFVNRGLEKPPDKPYLRLTAPSGEVWTWNPSSDTERIDGTGGRVCPGGDPGSEHRRHQLEGHRRHRRALDVDRAVLRRSRRGSARAGYTISNRQRQ